MHIWGTSEAVCWINQLFAGSSRFYGLRPNRPTLLWIVNLELEIKSKGRRHSDRFDDAANISSTAIVALPRKSNATGAACYRHHDSLATVTESLPQHRNNEVRKSPFCSKTMAQRRLANLSRTQSENVTPLDKADDVRFPRSVQALYLQPLRREAEYGIPSCDLQLRSFSLRNLEFFVDFALRAAYYLKLPAFGPVPLPRITERWTVPRSSFIFKKSQENFERITLRRLIQIRDGNPETVQLWLAFLQKHAYYGIGMKANVWDFGRLGECHLGAPATMVTLWLVADPSPAA